MAGAREPEGVAPPEIVETLNVLRRRGFGRLLIENQAVALDGVGAARVVDEERRPRLWPRRLLRGQLLRLVLLDHAIAQRILDRGPEQPVVTTRRAQLRADAAVPLGA